MKVPFRPKTDFSCSNTDPHWLHNYFLKGTFCLGRFCTRLVRLSKLLDLRLLNISTSLNNAATMKVYLPSLCPSSSPRPVVAWLL